jgi:hypothetical protein
MIVITKTKVIVTGPNPKTLALKQPKTKLAPEQPKTKVAAEQSKVKVAVVQVKKTKEPKTKLAAAQPKETKTPPIIVTKSKVIITGAASKVRVASVEKLMQQPKSIVAPESKSRARVAEADKKASKAGKTKPVATDARVAEADKNASKAGKTKPVAADVKVAGKAAGKNAPAGRAAQRIRTAAAS